MRALVEGRAADHRMDDEFALHLELETEKNVRQGMPPGEARRRARLAFGGQDAHRESMRDGRGTRWPHDLVADARYAVRTLGRSPVFATTAVLTLALGIGATTVIYSMVDGILLRPLPFAEPDRLVAVTDLGYRGELLELRRHARTMDVEAVGAGLEVSLTGDGEPERLEAVAVSGGAFALLGVPAALGRVIREADTEPGADPVVVLGHGLWQRRFGGAPSVIGESMRIDGVRRTVVGVLPPGTRFPSLGTQLWIPLELDAADAIGLWSTGAGTLIGRLRPGVTRALAQAELNTLTPVMRERFPWNMPADYGASAAVVDLREFMAGDVRSPLLMLLTAVALVLLIACVNVANLLLARASARQREGTVRAALGAGRGRLVRQHLTESTVLGLGGAVAGVLVAWAGLPLALRLLPADTPRIDGIVMDGRVLLATMVVGMTASLAFGLVPALRAAGRALQPGLAEGGRGGMSGPGRNRMAAGLAAAEVALAVVLVTGSLLVLKGFRELTTRDPGFITSGLVAATLAPPEFRYPGAEERSRLHERLLATLRDHGSTQAVALADRIPFGGRAHGSVFVIQGRPHPATAGGDWPWADVRAAVSDGWFDLLGIRVLEGRGILESDRENAPPVAVLSRQLAAQYWPDGNVLGQRITFPGDTTTLEIVGIVEDIHWERLSTVDGTLYLPLRQHPNASSISVLARGTELPVLPSAIRSVVTALDDATPVTDVMPLDALVGRAVQQPRASVVLLTLFALLALVLGAVGIYGVVTFAVAQRTREFGVRLALGASPAEIWQNVTAGTVRFVAVGLAAGLAGAAVLTRFLAAHLYGVSARDPAAFVAAPALLFAVSLLASWLPARRAARVDPAEALRGS